MSKRTLQLFLQIVWQQLTESPVILAREIDDKQNFTLVATLTAAK